MPPRPPVGLFDRTLSTWTRSPFICPVCRHRKALSVKAHTQRVRQSSVRPRELSKPRTASTTASVTAVNAKKEIPFALQELHGSLKALEIEAGVYVNTSQLQLALRGVESENPVTRIAGQTDLSPCLTDSYTNAGGSSWTQWRTRCSEAYQGLASGPLGTRTEVGEANYRDRW